MSTLDGKFAGIPGLAELSPTSVVALIRSNDPQSVVMPLPRKLRDEQFAAASMHVLVRDISLPLRLLMIAAKRRKAPFDVLARIDLSAEVSQDQAKALAEVKAELDCLLFLTANRRFHRAGIADAA